MISFKKYVPITFILLSYILFFSLEASANFDIENAIKATLTPVNRFIKYWWFLLILLLSSVCIGIDWYYHRRLTGLAIALSLIGSIPIVYLAFSA